MGRFTYEGAASLTIDDRKLAHLQVVIVGKLRRREGFTFTWREDRSLGGGRQSVWMHPSAALTFTYSGQREPQLSHAWLEALAFTANSPRGLYLVPEPPQLEGAEPLSVEAA